MSNRWTNIRGDPDACPELRAAYDRERTAYLLGSTIRELREKQGISQTELAARTQMTQPNVSRLEAGTGGVPTLETLDRVGRALRVDVSIRFGIAAASTRTVRLTSGDTSGT